MVVRPTIQASALIVAAESSKSLDGFFSPQWADWMRPSTELIMWQVTCGLMQGYEAAARCRSTSGFATRIGVPLANAAMASGMSP